MTSTICFVLLCHIMVTHYTDIKPTEIDKRNHFQKVDKSSKSKTLVLSPCQYADLSKLYHFQQLLPLYCIYLSLNNVESNLNCQILVENIVIHLRFNLINYISFLSTFRFCA